VKIEDGKFYSDQYHGEFVTVESENQNWPGLKIYDSWNMGTWKDYKYEIGLKRDEELGDFMEGKYTEASTQILDSVYLAKFSKEELRIMRNEIFARYRYRFAEGSEMANYFATQKWYGTEGRRYTSVSEMLTWIELKNIELIKKMEEAKR